MINMEGLKDFDPAEYLDDAPSIAAYLDEAFKTENPEYISHALGVAAKAKGMTDIAQKSGIRREQLYRSLNSKGNPTLQTLLPVMKALGVTIGVSVKGTQKAPAYPGRPA